MPDQEDDELSQPVSSEDEQPERPSIGQLIAGVKQPAYMPQAGIPDAADVSAPAMPPNARPPLDPNSIPDVIRPKALRPEEIPTAGSNLPDLARRQAAVATPINPVDPATGKILPKYRMGTGSRILAALSDFASGFSKNPQQIPFGPGATNWRFGRDEAARQGQLEGINTEIGTQARLDTENQKQRESLLKQAYQEQLGEKAAALGKAAEENASTRKALESSQAEKNAATAELARTKAGQTPEPKTEVELALAYQTAAAAKDPKAAIYKGALDALARQKAAGKDTTASDVLKIHPSGRISRTGA